MARRQVSGGLLTAQYGLPPLPYVRAEGSWIYAPDGRRYLDGSSGLICVNVGHAHPTVVAALARQAGTAAFASPGIFRPTLQEQLAVETARAVHRPTDSVVLTCTGTSAIEMALMLGRLTQRARGETGRSRVLTASLSYHGNSAFTLALSGHRRRRPHADDSFGLGPTFDPPYPGLHRDCQFETCRAECADEVATAIDTVGAHRVAAVLIEPINGTTGGGYQPPNGYMARLRRLCAERGVLLIHDEVLTGLGRTGLPLAAHHAPGSEADITVLSKGLGAGYVPLGAVLLASEHSEAVLRSDFPLPIMGTMSATPVQAAVGSAVLAVLRDLGALNRMHVRGAAVERAVRTATRGLPVVTAVRGAGYFFGIEVDDGRQAAIISAAREYGVILYPFDGFRPDGSGEGVIVAPPLTINEEETDFLATALRAALEQVSDTVAAIGPVKP